MDKTLWDLLRRFWPFCWKLLRKDNNLVSESVICCFFNSFSSFVTKKWLLLIVFKFLRYVNETKHCQLVLYRLGVFIAEQIGLVKKLLGQELLPSVL